MGRNQRQAAASELLRLRRQLPANLARPAVPRTARGCLTNNHNRTNNSLSSFNSNSASHNYNSNNNDYNTTSSIGRETERQRDRETERQSCRGTELPYN